MVHDRQLLDFLQRLGAAISAGRLEEVASCWSVPALILTDDGALLIQDRQQIELMFGEVAGAYRSRGIASTEPEILRADRLTERLVATDVRWPYLDSDGNSLGTETSSYILWVDAEGQLLLRVALSRAGEGTPRV
jgi:hypothetical protein